MRTVRFILKLGLKILAAPVVLALMLFTWVCFGLLYVSSFIFGLASTVVVLLGIAVLVTYSPQKRRNPAGDRLSGQPAGPSDGRRLAGGQSAGPAVCDPGRGVWLNRRRRIAGSEAPAFLTLLSC